MLTTRRLSLREATPGASLTSESSLPPKTVALLERRVAHLKARLADGNDLSGNNCDCGCHRRFLEHLIKDCEAKLRGGFHYYHEDCDCCFPSFNFGSTKCS